MLLKLIDNFLMIQKLLQQLKI